MQCPYDSAIHYPHEAGILVVLGPTSAALGMDYEIAVESRYLRAKMSGRDTGEETREFLRSIILENLKYQRSSILLDLRSSRPIFHAKPHGFFEFFRMLADGSSCKIALLGDADDLHMSHEYVALLARQQGMNVRSFRDEADALLWLGERRFARDRRRPQAQGYRPEQGMPEDRRQGRRRVNSTGSDDARTLSL